MDTGETVSHPANPQLTPKWPNLTQLQTVWMPQGPCHLGLSCPNPIVKTHLTLGLEQASTLPSYGSWLGGPSVT